MNSVSPDQMNLMPLVELFGTFFEKLTKNHQHKDPLRKEFSEFKCVLYTSQMNSAPVDTYLDSLRTQKFISGQNLAIKPEIVPVTNAILENSASNLNNRSNVKAKTVMIRTKKAEVLSLSGFLKYRSMGQADKKQVLRSRYSHVQSLDKDPSNLYRILGLSYFTLLLQSSLSKNKLPDIIDEVAAKRLQLSCSAENLTHEDLCGIFCGLFSELMRMKRQQESVGAILQAFYEMIDSDKNFGVALSSFVKAKIYAFVEQNNTPYELIAFKTHLQSKAFKEKVEGNDISQLDCVLRLVPFIFDKQVVAHIFENGKISEVFYKPFKSKKQREEERLKPINEELSIIHILVEKVFLTVSFFGLFTHRASPFNTDLRNPIKKEASVSTTVNQDPSARLLLTEDPTKKLAPEALNNIKRALKTRTLTVDTISLSNPRTTAQNSIFSTSTPRTANSSQISQEKGSQKDQRPGASSARLLFAQTPTKTLGLNFGSDIGKNLQSENKAFPPQGDLGVVSELTAREPFEEDNSHEEQMTSEKENEHTRLNGGSVSPTRINHIMAPSYLTKKEPNVQSPYSADKLSERSYNRNYTATPSSFSYKPNANTSYNEAANKAEDKKTETKPYQSQAGHARTNSYGAYGDPHPTSKLPHKYEIGGTPKSVKSYVGIPPPNKYQVLKGSESAKSFNVSSYQKSMFNDKQHNSPQTADRFNYYTEIYNEITTSSPRILTTTGDEPSSKYQEQIQSSTPLDITNSPSSGQANTSTYQSKAKLKSIISMTPKSVLNIQTNSPSLATNSPKDTKSYYSNYAANTSYGNSYRHMSPTLKLGYNESSPTANRYPTNLNYSYQGQQTVIQTYKPSYTPKAGVQQNSSFRKEAVSSYNSFNQSTNSYQNGGYSSPFNYNSTGGAGRNTSVSFGNQVTTLSTNTSFNNNPQTLTNQALSQTRLP